jgi:hypothetical protein
MGARDRACQEQQCGSETRYDEQIAPPNISENTRRARLEPTVTINDAANYHGGLCLESLTQFLR